MRGVTDQLAVAGYFAICAGLAFRHRARGGTAELWGGDAVCKAVLSLAAGEIAAPKVIADWFANLPGSLMEIYFVYAKSMNRHGPCGVVSACSCSWSLE